VISHIKAYKRIYPWLHTSGQPTEEQLQGLGEEGIRTVVNLALPSSENAVRDEAAVLAGQGITYLNIPVDFREPRFEEFNLFRNFLSAFTPNPVLVHCALNMRVSVFVYLFRVLEVSGGRVLEGAGDVSDEVSRAEEDMYSVWNPDTVWSGFIRTCLTSPRCAVRRETR
jgi:protein tyrosine phosphatase (PTP) superfamily phosphohydrolase (DUF442 family)